MGPAQRPRSGQSGSRPSTKRKLRERGYWSPWEFCTPRVHAAVPARRGTCNQGRLANTCAKQRHSYRRGAATGLSPTPSIDPAASWSDTHSSSRALEQYMRRPFLVSFRPLCRTLFGRHASAQFGLPSFVDGSIRREPDLESAFPSITALCRNGNFAPRLQESDRIAYITNRGAYGPISAPHWRLVALLRVKHRRETHEKAAEWYAEHGESPPRNCMIRENNHVPFDHSDGFISPKLRKLTGGCNLEQVIRKWDAGYRIRAREHGDFLICERLFCDLSDPPVIYKHDWVQWYGRIPSTQNPPQISEDLWSHLCRRAGLYV